MRKSALFIWCLAVACFVVACSQKVDQRKVDTQTTVAEDTTATLSQEPRLLRIMMMGDIMMGSQCPWDGRFMTKDDGKSLFDSVKPIIAQGDFIVGNLEGVLLDRTPQSEKQLNTFSAVNFMMPQRYVHHLVDAGFTAMAITNNHANDFCQMGIDSTTSTLRRANMPYSGVKREGGYTLINKDGITYALCAFSTSPGAYHLDDFDAARKVIMEADTLADIVVVSFHGGCEGTSARRVPKCKEVFNNGFSRGDVYKFARMSVDAGADVVFGHSPHVVRAMEIYNDRIIAYSLGNFCTPTGMNNSLPLGYAPLLDVTVDSIGKFVKGRIHSFIQRNGQGPILDANHGAAREIDRLSHLDFPDTRLIIDSVGNITRPISDSHDNR